MVHVRSLLDTRRARFDGSFNIIYRITHYKKVYTLSSGISIHTHHWNSHSSEIDRNHPNAARLNLKLSKRFFEIQRALLGKTCKILESLKKKPLCMWTR